jgi:hypothetical protein
MILADDILAAGGGPDDPFDMLGSIGRGLQDAERFVLTDDIAMAGYQLIRSRPSSLLSAMPMCRVPYPRVWMEWNGKASDAAGWPFLSTYERLNFKNAPLFHRHLPIKLGCLIEADERGEQGTMTWAWMLPDRSLSASGMSVNFDYTGNIMDWATRELGDDEWLELVKRLHRNNSNLDKMEAAMRETCWKAIAGDPKEREALARLSDYELPWFSRHATKFIAALTPDTVPEITRAWMGDIVGECPFVSAVFTMMNSRNAVEHEPNDVSKLNKARAKKGKPPILSHRITRLHLTKARMRDAERSGMSRAEMRTHMVRGHFKLRRTGVYWWSAFVRGRGAGAKREHYEVAP